MCLKCHVEACMTAHDSCFFRIILQLNIDWTLTEQLIERLSRECTLDRLTSVDTFKELVRTENVFLQRKNIHGSLGQESTEDSYMSIYECSFKDNNATICSDALNQKSGYWDKPLNVTQLRFIDILYYLQATFLYCLWKKDS